MKLLLIIGIFTWYDGLIEAQRRLFNANTTNEGQFPYMAYLAYRNGTITCGASIIHRRWLLTAAHCVLRYEDDPTVTVGTTKSDGSGGGETYIIDKTYVHKDFKVLPEHLNDGLEYVANDIGLLHTNRAIKFTDKVKAIPLAKDKRRNYNGNDVVISGWGKTDFRSDAPKDLHFINVPVKNHNQCRRIWTYITNKYVCTSSYLSGVCYYDSGSPVVWKGVQIGIVSTCDKYCESKKPDLHTRVSSFIPWINKILRKCGNHL